MIATVIIVAASALAVTLTMWGKGRDDYERLMSGVAPPPGREDQPR